MSVSVVDEGAAPPTPLTAPERRLPRLWFALLTFLRVYRRAVADEPTEAEKADWQQTSF